MPTYQQRDRTKERERPQALAVRLEVERLNLLYLQNVAGMVGLLIHVVCYWVVAYRQVPLWFLIPWSAILLGAGLARLVGSLFWWRTRGKIRSIEETRPWFRFMLVMLAISGLGWGAIGWMTGLASDPLLQIFTAMALMFMAAGAIATYAAWIQAMYCVLLPAMIPWALRFFTSGETPWVLMGGLALVYVGLATMVGRNLNAYVDRSMRLHVENDKLTSVLEKQILIKEEARQALRDSEARLRFALESSDATAWSWDLPSDTLTFEGHLSATLGIDAERFEGRSDEYLNFVQPEDRQALLKQMDAAAAGRGELDSEHRVIWPDGSIHYLILRGRVQFHDGAPVRLVGVCWNVTARRTEEALLHERDVFDAANKAKSVFLANASHEIRTPLAAINGFAEILANDPALPEASRTDVEVILRNGRYLVSLVSDLLDLSKIETGRLYIQKNSISPFHEINDALLVVRDEVERKKLALDVVYENAIPEKIESDGNRFRQILVNLLENAVKFTDKGGLSVRVSFEADGRGEGLLRVLVADTGIGLRAEARDLLFQPFARGHSAEVQRVQGSGLGLALSRDLSRLLGGDLRLVHSEPNVGSEFELTLATGPVRTQLVQKENALPPTAFPGLESEVAPRRLEGRRLLVVDDVPDLREFMVRALRDQGAVVDTAANGIEALNLALTKPYDTILMDIKMPIMDGYEVAKILRSREYDTPVIALTAHASNEDRQRSFAAGFDDYVSKPVDLEHIVDLIVSHLPRPAEEAAMMPAEPTV